MRKLLVSASCSVTLLLGACGSESSSGGVDTPTPATATTSTAAPAPTSLAPPTTAAATTSSTVVSSTTTAPTTDATPPPTSATTDDSSTVDSATVDTTTDDTTASDHSAETVTTESHPASSAPPGVVTGYTAVESPIVPGSTMPVAADGRHPDGVFYASVSEGGDPDPAAAGSVVFEIVQLFTGDDCVAHFGEDDVDSCVNNYGVETDPTSAVEVALTDQYISVVDAATQQSYRVSGAELHELILGGLPSVGAPADYLYIGFGFLVTYQDGEITRLEQWWTP